nr:hypothetical protein [Tanacetum cinerariifolium]
MASLADKPILSGADNRPPMLEKDMYDSWKSRMELYMLDRPHGRMILESVEQVFTMIEWKSYQCYHHANADSRFKFKVKDFIQDLLKIQVAQKKVKLAFENADSSSRVELIPSKIKYAIKVVLSFHKEFLVFSSFSRKGNDGLLQDQVFKNKEEVVIKVT